MSSTADNDQIVIEEVITLDDPEAKVHLHEQGLVPVAPVHVNPIIFNRI